MTPPQRLSALDAAFVALDARGAPYHVGSVLTFEGFDVLRVREYVAACLDRLPRYRQRIQRVPLLGHPVWVDDPHLDLRQHVLTTTVSPPGSARQLDELVGRIFSEDLPRDRPPWQLWIVEGLERDAVAIVAKVHHCLVDGVAGVNLLQDMLRGVPDASLPARVGSSPHVPSGLELLGAELAYRARGLVRLPGRLGGDFRELAPALATLVKNGLHPGPDVGINPRRVGRERIMAGWQIPMDEVIRAKRMFQVTVNDTVLAIAAGALRRFLLRRGVSVSRLTDFRAMVPVSTHEVNERAVAGNRVALLLVPLPIDEPDPRRRIERVAAATRDRKGRAHEAAAGELLVQVSDVTAPSLLAAVLGLSTDRRGFNVIITNIPGPPFPLYLLGARLRSFRPIVNLWPGQALGMALLSYSGTLYWGLHADRRVVPDLDVLVADLAYSFAELRAEKHAAPMAEDGRAET